MSTVDNVAAAIAGAREDVDVSVLRAQIRTLRGKLAETREAKQLLAEAVIEATVSATLGQGGIPAVVIPARDRRASKAEVALWDTGDWQLGKTTTTYGSDVAEERVMAFCDKAIRITELMRADHPVRECVIVFGGDMVEGVAFNFPTQPHEIDKTLFDQFVQVSQLLVKVVRKALATYDKVYVVSEWGNHGRIGSKRDSVPLGDNVDRMCYETAKRLLADEKRLTWNPCPDNIQRLEIGNYRALVIHGDEVGRMGFASPSTIVQHVNRWRSGAYRVEGEPWEFRDVYMHHYHTHAEWPLANGEGAVYQTGSTESDNNYAGVHMAASATPSQRLHFIDPERGRVTSQYKVYLDA